MEYPCVVYIYNDNILLFIPISLPSLSFLLLIFALIRTLYSWFRRRRRRRAIRAINGGAGVVVISRRRSAAAPPPTIYFTVLVLALWRRSDGPHCFTSNLRVLCTSRPLPGLPSAPPSLPLPQTHHVTSPLPTLSFPGSCGLFCVFIHLCICLSVSVFISSDWSIYPTVKEGENDSFLPSLPSCS